MSVFLYKQQLDVRDPCCFATDSVVGKVSVQLAPFVDKTMDDPTLAALVLDALPAVGAKPLRPGPLARQRGWNKREVNRVLYKYLLPNHLVARVADGHWTRAAGVAADTPVAWLFRSAAAAAAAAALAAEHESLSGSGMAVPPFGPQPQSIAFLSDGAAQVTQTVVTAATGSASSRETPVIEIDAQVHSANSSSTASNNTNKRTVIEADAPAHSANRRSTISDINVPRKRTTIDVDVPPQLANSSSSSICDTNLPRNSTTASSTVSATNVPSRKRTVIDVDASPQPDSAATDLSRHSENKRHARH